MYLTYKFRLKNAKNLANQALIVNFVWNFCKETQNTARRRNMQWPSRFDLYKLLAGASKSLGILATTCRGVADTFISSRTSHNRVPRWRSRKSLGWVPFASVNCNVVSPDRILFNGVNYPLWIHRKVEGRIVCGSFNEDARGRWYVNLTCEVAEASVSVGIEEIGIDLGLKTMATLSTGEKLENPRHYRREEEKLAVAQRARRKHRTRAIHAKIKNRRKHDLHVASTKLVKRCRSIYVGNVNAKALTQTNFAKNVTDVGWSMFRAQLAYKAIRHGVRYKEVDERYTTQTCSSCKERSGPRGLKGLEVREWICLNCNASHDRDTNAAKNILFLGQSVDLQTDGKVS